MSRPQNGRNSQLSERRPRSARSRGLRTLQHQALARSTLAAIDAEIWLRALIVERARAEGEQGALADSAWATKDQVHDEALAWFLAQPSGSRAAAPGSTMPIAPVSATKVPARTLTHQDVTFWIDSQLLTRARRVALARGQRVAAVLEQALADYVRIHISDEVLRFHRRAQRQAQRLLARRHPATVAQQGPSAILLRGSIGLVKRRART